MFSDGQGPSTGSPPSIRPEGAGLVPKVTLIDPNSVFFQKPSVFVLEKLRFVMRFLIFNIGSKCGQMRWADTEDTIAILPLKGGKCRGKRFRKFGRILLQNLQDLFHRFVLGEMATDVNVIGDPSNGDLIALKGLQAPAHVGPDPRTNLVGQQWLPVFRRKHDMNRKNVQGLRHFGMPLQGKAGVAH